MRHRTITIMVIIYIIATSLSSQKSNAFGAEEIAETQRALKGKSTGEKIAFWAEHFVGRPYDPDYLGEYVRKEVIVTDERIDCMYHVFRSVELAMSDTPEGAVEEALNRRFHTKGVIKDSRVLNYSDRFQYGEDMIVSGKWGKDVTSTFGPTAYVGGSRGINKLAILSKKQAIKALGNFNSGDIVFFIKDPKKRQVGEIVGHIGIVKKELNNLYLIHANGQKGKDSGEVKKVPLKEYLHAMNFVGIKITRF
ncbi:MAG: hypothetical protein HZC12_02030 [Nitrospirae bacterium]|nr:hypothetical protein [Nitrospirota bacterium]